MALANAGTTFALPATTGYGGYGGAGYGAVGTTGLAVPRTSLGENITQSQQTNQSLGQQASQGQNLSQSYIPDYSQTPILEGIAQYAQSMAPQVYQWGMDQFNKNQGNIDTLMRNALTYASPQRIATDVGAAESGVMQGAEAGRQNAIRDLQSYGIDPSSGRYAALDKATQVMSAASAAGAGNQQRNADIATGNAMQNQAISAGLQNTQIGYGASGAMNALLGTGMQLKYSPLGTTSTGETSSSGSSESSGQSTSMGAGFTEAGQAGAGTGGGGGGGQPAGGGRSQGQGMFGGVESRWLAAEGGPAPTGYQTGGPTDDATAGGFVSPGLSPTRGARTDDVPAQLNAGEFVIPKDVSAWLGQEHFYKLMAKARKDRAMMGSGNEAGAVGYGAS